MVACKKWPATQRWENLLPAGPVDACIALIKQSAGGLVTLQLTSWTPSVKVYS